MARIVSSASGPIPPDPDDPAPRLTDGKEVIAVQLYDKRVTEQYVEFRLQYSTGELERFCYWFNPRTNNQRRETALALKNWPHSLEAAVQTNKERGHDKRETRHLGKRLRGEAERKNP
jgi:hypothetical protein